MTLRTRLIVAFLLMSVVPLAAVTGYSYVSTRNAFRQSAEIKSDLMAEELGRRMEIVTGDIERRVGRIWRMARPGSPPPDQPPGTPPWAQAPRPDDVAQTLGNFASLVEKLELVPGERFPPPSAGGPPSVPPGMRPPGPPSPPGPGGSPQRGVTSSDGARTGTPASGANAPSAAGTQKPRTGSASPAGTGGERAAAAAAGAATPATGSSDRTIVVEVPRPIVAVDTTRLSAEMQAAVTAANENLRRETTASRGDAGSRATQAGGRTTRTGTPPARRFDFNVVEDGQHVGTVRARVNLERMLRGVLMMTRRDQGEVPFAVDADGKLHTSNEADTARLAELDLAKRARAQHTGRSSDGEWVLVTREMPDGVVFGIARPIAGSMAELRNASARNLGLGLAFIVLALAGVLPLSNRMTRNLRTLSQGVERIAGGDLSTQVDVRSKDEFGRLAAAFNKMARDLTTHERLVVEQERLRRELELSRQIQNEMLPRGILRVGIAEVKGVSIPAREVGGDFFNYFPLPSGELALMVGDVSGKGISAALLMANIQATLKARLPLEADLAALADVIDRDVHQNTPPEVYLTLFVGLLDPTGRRLRYVNAGHNPQFVLRSDGGIEQLHATGLPVGLLPGRGYQEKAVSLGETDLLFFYTDGTVEIENAEGDFFGYERLAAVITRERMAGVEAVLADVEDALRAFRGTTEPTDDATMMALRLGPHVA